MKVTIAGAAGQMGREAVKAIHAAPDLELIGAVSPRHAGQDAGAVAGIGDIGLAISGDLDECLALDRPDVLVDLTSPASVARNIEAALRFGVHPVVGSTGLTDEHWAILDGMARDRELRGLVAPNFAIGALLMIRFAAEAAKYFDHAEVIELHHDRKKDAPSGTALTTVGRMLGAREAFAPPAVAGEETLPGARGGEAGGVRVHSVRLPGLVAHQEVLFGGLGQLLTIRHDALSRECYMPGVLLAVRRVKDLDPGLWIGLENVM